MTNRENTTCSMYKLRMNKQETKAMETGRKREALYISINGEKTGTGEPLKISGNSVY